MNYAVRKSEITLFWIKVIATIGVWIGIIAIISMLINESTHIVTVITVFVYIAIILLYLWFYKVYLIAYMKGNGICLTERQFPEIYQIYCEIGKEMGLKKIPPLFILQSGGVLNAFAIRLSGKNYVAIYSDIFSEYKDDIDAVKFVLAHELGHIIRCHNQKRFWTMPSSIIPFLTAAYSRACEYTCDNIGSACIQDEKSKLHGILLLAGGKDIYKEINIDDYVKMAKENRTFAVKFINLFISHPYLPKRIENIANNAIA